MTDTAGVTTSLNISAVAAPGQAASNNSLPADILVVVSDFATGNAVADLGQSDFTIIEHFTNPNQVCGFSQNVTMFNNVGTGAYQIQVSLQGCTWVPGDYLLQVLIAGAGRMGQTTAKFSVA